jgi:hypothetical protein
MNCTKIMAVILAVLPAIAIGEGSSTAPAVATMPAVRQGSPQATAPTSVPAPVKMKVAYLGVAAMPLDSATAKQLNVTGGLRVLFVVGQSPADQAGLKRGDILVRLDDQLLINLQQFTVLVRSFAPGRQFALKIYRGAEAMTLTAKLGQQEMPAGAADIVIAGSAGVPTVSGPLYDLSSVPRKYEPNTYASSCTNGQYALKYFATGGQQMLIVIDARNGRKVFSGAVDTAEELAKLQPDVRPLLANLQKDRARLERQAKLPPPKFVPTQVIYNDNANNMTLREESGHKFLIVKDKLGATLFNGSVDMPDQVQTLPAEIQAKLEWHEDKVQHLLMQ